MSNYYGFEDNESNHGQSPVEENLDKKVKRKFSIKMVISLVLVSSVISSSLVGGVLYSKFSADLNKQTLLLQSAAKTSDAGSTKSAVASNLNLTKTALAKGAPTTEIAKKVGPSIVGIRINVNTKQNWFSGADSLGQSAGEGSGVIISSDGYIMTNYHVVEYADPKNKTSQSSTLEVFLPDKQQATAKFIGGDSKNDLAVIKIELNNLPVAELGDSSMLEVGEQAIAIGNPLGMEFAGSVTAGVISALNRAVTMEDKTLNLIQTDAAINPGNSGGALVNSQGQVIGINTVKISVAGVEGLGFAIPVNEAKPIIDQLMMFGYVKGRPFIGISGREVTEALSKTYDLPQGIYIAEVTPESGAGMAGIKKGDVLVNLAGQDVKTMKDLDSIKKNNKAGDTVDAVAVRNGERKTLKMTYSEEK